MKKILFTILFIVFLVSPSYAFNHFVVCVGQPIAVSGGDCPGGDETFYWDGDHSTSTVTACDNTGSAITGTQSDGTISTDYGQSGYGFRKTAQNQWIRFPVSTSDFDAYTGTVWMSIYVTDDGTLSWDTLGEYYADYNNKIKLAIYSTGKLYVEHKSNSVTNFKLGDDTVPLDGWVRVGFSWDSANGKEAVKVGAGSWTERTGLTMVDFNASNFDIGEYQTGGSEADTIDIDNVSVFGTYQAADPGT